MRKTKIQQVKLTLAAETIKAIQPLTPEQLAMPRGGIINTAKAGRYGCP